MAGGYRLIWDYANVQGEKYGKIRRQWKKF
jgi:hypothetical protein